MADAEYVADHEHVYRCQDCGEIGGPPTGGVPKPDGWISAPLPVLGEGPDLAHWTVACSDCRWTAQGYGLAAGAIVQLQEHRQERHSDGGDHER